MAAFWFLRGVRRGVVTTRYPKVTDPWAADLPTPPIFSVTDLTSAIADQMVEVCPSGALRREEAFLVMDIGACTACGRCVAVAGTVARPSGTFELATTSRADLVKRIPVLAERAETDQ